MDASLPPDVQKALEIGYAHLLANKYYILASTVMLVYDHILTLEQERLYIWNRPKSLPSYLFFVFRYVTPIVSLINLIAEHDPRWTGPTCSNWIWLPVATGPIISAATGVIMILRVHAIYARSKWILIVTIPIYLAQLGIMAWSIPAGVPAPLPPGFIGCVPSEKSGTGRRLSALYIAALAFDATIFCLTLGKAVYMRVTQTSIPLVQLIVRDGTLYFMVIFFVNLVNVLLLSLAPPDISAINGPFASMITAILVARLVLNLREAGQSMQVVVSNGRKLSTNLSLWAPADPSRTESSRTYHEVLGLDEFTVDLTWRTAPGTDESGLVPDDMQIGGQHPQILDSYELVDAKRTASQV